MKYLSQGGRAPGDVKDMNTRSTRPTRLLHLGSSDCYDGTISLSRTNPVDPPFIHLEEHLLLVERSFVHPISSYFRDCSAWSIVQCIEPSRAKCFELQYRKFIVICSRTPSAFFIVLTTSSVRPSASALQHTLVDIPSSVFWSLSSASSLCVIGHIRLYDITSYRVTNSVCSTLKRTRKGQFAI